MRSNFQNQLDSINTGLIDMVKLVEESVDLSVQGLIDIDKEKAKKVIRMDNDIDKKEYEIEEECLHLFALQSPLAKDLRFNISILKIITDLERIGDYSVNIAKIVLEMTKDEHIKPLVDIPKMMNVSKEMLELSIKSYIEKDSELAKKVITMDDILDDLYELICIDILKLAKDNQDVLKESINLLFVGRYLERIGDHIVNICERIIYITSGEKVVY